MLQTEFVRSLHCNYERFLLDKMPEEKRYQYCIMNRGGIKGLLPCNLRYINGLAYLYYEITSKQSVSQLYHGRCITREWLKDFIWSVEQLQQELGRFLLDGKNVLWYPEQVFQDLESNIFSYIYIPYYDGEGSFLKLLEYLVEHIDYEDEELVECVYKMYEQYEKNGDVYLQSQIFKDAALQKQGGEQNAITSPEKDNVETTVSGKSEDMPQLGMLPDKIENSELIEEKKGIISLLKGKKKSNKDKRKQYELNKQLEMEGYMVAEEVNYEEYGRTIYIEEQKEPQPIRRGLYTADGTRLFVLDKNLLTIGKKKGEVDCVLEDMSVSRMHARIMKEQETYYIEDLNATNGTFKNGLRMQPYEKRKLEEGDEIRLGKVIFTFK